MIHRPLPALYAGMNFGVGDLQRDCNRLFLRSCHPERAPCVNDFNPRGLMRFEKTQSRPALLDASPDRRPLRKGQQPVAVFPGKLEEFPRIKVGGFFAKKCFEPPPQIRALPGL